MNEWISIEERIPEKDGRYIVFEPRYKWVGVSSVRQGKFDDITSTHWQPLPEPPKGE